MEKHALPLRKVNKSFIAIDGKPFIASFMVDIDVLPPEWKIPVTLPFFVIDSSIDILLGEDSLSALGCSMDYSRGFVEFRQRVHAVSSIVVKNSEFLKMFNMGIFANNHEFKQMLLEFRDIFSIDENDLGRTHLTCHRIDTGKNDPVFIPQFRRSKGENEIINEYVSSMLENDIIEPSTSAWGSPIFLVDKKESKKKRLVVDFRKVNELSRKDKFPMLHIDDALDKLAGCTVFSDVDATSGYWQVPLSDDSKEKTAFHTTKGSFQFKVLPFGLCNGPSTFQRMMTSILEGLDMPVYLDNIINATHGSKDHIKRLRSLFERIRKAGLKLKPSKCHFGQTEIPFLGFVVGDGKLRPDPEKVSAIRGYAVPSKPSDLQTFLGLCTFYRRFIKNFSEIASPLYDLQNKSPKAFTRSWCDDHLTAYMKLRDYISDHTYLTQPNFDKMFYLDIDASQIAAGAVLYQFPNSPVSFASHKFTSAERNYSTTDREFFALQWAIGHFRPYLLDKHFVVRTDHKPLLGLHCGKPHSARHVRYQNLLSEYTYELQFVPGKLNVVADAMSRSIVKDTDDAVKVSAVSIDRNQISDIEIVKRYHNAGHFGEDRTRSAVRSGGHKIPFLRKLIRSVVSECETCANKSYGGQNIPSGALPTDEVMPREFVAIDIVGPLPNIRNFRFVLTMLDHNSRYLEAVPLQRVDARTCTKAFLHNWVYRHGPPRILHSDRGTQFESEIMKLTLQSVGIQRSRTTAYHPQGNSCLERIHRTLKDRLRCAGKNWLDKLQESVFQINSTGLENKPTPFEAFYSATTYIPADWPTKPRREYKDIKCPRYIHARINLPSGSLSPRFGKRMSVQKRISPQLVQAEGKVYHLKNCRIIW